jgi:hypothetical protein
MPSLESKKAASQLSSVAAAVIIHHLINRLASSGLDNQCHFLALCAMSGNRAKDISGSRRYHPNSLIEIGLNGDFFCD